MDNTHHALIYLFFNYILFSCINTNTYPYYILNKFMAGHATRLSVSSDSFLFILYLQVHIFKIRVRRSDIEDGGLEEVVKFCKIGWSRAKVSFFSILHYCVSPPPDVLFMSPPNS